MTRNHTQRGALYGVFITSHNIYYVKSYIRAGDLFLFYSILIIRVLQVYNTAVVNKMLTLVVHYVRKLAVRTMIDVVNCNNSDFAAMLLEKNAEK